MILSRLLLAIALLAMSGCVAQQKAHLETFNIGAYERNWDEIDIVGVDRRRVSPCRQLTITPGWRTVTFRVSYMRGDMKKPIFAEVPVSVEMLKGRRYRVNVHYKSYGMMGAFISELDTPVEEYSLRAGVLVWSREYDEYQQKKK